MSTRTRTPTIPPYWTRFPSFFLYPFSFEPLLANCGLALLATFASVAFTPINILLGFMFFIGTGRYGFLVLERTARGYLDDRMAVFDSEHGGKYLPYKQIAVLLIGLTLAGWVGRAAGQNAAMLVLGLLALLWPANTMLLALTNDLGESITPGRLLHVATRIGLPYLSLCGCLFLLTACGPALLGLVAPKLPKWLLIPVFASVTVYFTIAMYRMMGYVLYQYHREIGLDVHVDFDRQTQLVPAKDARAARAEEIAERLREGRSEDALELARAAVREAPGDHEARSRLHRLLAVLPGNEDVLVRHAREWLPLLLRAQRGSQAVEVFEGLLAKQPDFQLSDADQLLPLAQAAFDARRYDTTARLLRGFDQRHPGHGDTAAIYLLGARLLIEHKRDEAQAERVLATLRNRFPQHPAAAEAEKLQQLIARLRAVT
jgi:hypothetical protein